MIYFPTLNIMFNHFLSNPSCIQSLTKTTYPTPPPSAIPAWCSDACPRRHVQWPTSSSKHCVSPVATKGTPSLYLFLISNRIKSEIPMRVEIDTWEQHHIDVHWHEDCQDHVKKGHWFCVPIETGVSTADKNMQKFCQCWNLDFKTMHTTAKESQVHLHNFFKRQMMAMAMAELDNERCLETGFRISSGPNHLCYVPSCDLLGLAVSYWYIWYVFCFKYM